MAILPSFSVKDIIELVKKGAAIDAEEKIIELRRAALDLQDENARLHEELRLVKHTLELRGLAFDRGVYRKGDDGPFCQLCCDVHSKLVRLHDYANCFVGSPDNSRVWHCYNCNNDFPQNPA